jgi:hypothetical protein
MKANDSIHRAENERDEENEMANIEENENVK